MDSGTCGENPTWTLDEEGTLTISGTGIMYNCTKEDYVSWYKDRDEIYHVIIEEGVTSIGKNAFSPCSRLSDVTISNSVTTIGERAFHHCVHLTKVKIPDSVTSIGERAFEQCTGLKDVDIPNSVTSIGKVAFAGCTSLEYVDIPDSVTIIDESTFQNCTSLTHVTIPNSVKRIFTWAFLGCSSLRSISIPDSVIYLTGFDNCTGLTHVTIPGSVTDIGMAAFSGCSSLESVTISNGVESIGKYAFEKCSSLTSVTIPDSVTDIWDKAFEKCSSLKSITIHSSVKSIKDNVFSCCDELETVYFCGSRSDWEAITIGEGNEQLLNAKIYFDWRGLSLDPKFSCFIGETITVSATYTSKENKTITASVMTDAGDSLEISSAAIKGPNEVGSNYESYISFTVTGKKTGEYDLNLITSDGNEANTRIEVLDRYSINFIEDEGYSALKTSFKLGEETSLYAEIKSGKSLTDEESEAEKVKWSIEDSSYADIDYNHYVTNICKVSIIGKRPGKTKLIATFSDGTTFNREFYIEPEMKVSVGAQYHNGEIEKTDQVISYCDVWCKVSMDGYDADKEYLEDFIGSITYNEDELKEIISVVDHTTEVSEDGMTAWMKLRFTGKENEMNKRIRFVFKSTTQQTARSEEITVKKDLIAKLRYRACGDTDKQHSFLFKDEYFFLDSAAYHNDLAVMSLGLEMSAYSSHDYDSQYTSTVSSENGRNKNLKDAFKTLGFKDPVFFKYDVPLSDSSNYAAFGITKKTICTWHDSDTLIAVAIRGGAYGAEWASNYDIGTSGDAMGFRNAADYALAELISYIDDLKKSGEYAGKLKIWIVGFSRGAAVANILAHKINKKELGIEINPENLYAYTFATPNGQQGTDFSDTNIFNTVSTSDIVPRVPLYDKWGFSKYGNTNGIIGCFTNEYVKNSFKNYTGETLNVFDAAEDISGVLDFLKKLVPNRNEFVSMAQDSIMKSYKNGYAEKEKGQNILLCLIWGIITSPALDGKLIAGPDFVNAWEEGDYVKAAVQVGKRTVGLLTDHQVGKVLSAAVDNLSLISIMQSHYPEHYLAWLESGGIKEMGHDTYAYLNDGERELIEYNIGQQFEKQIAKRYDIYCPVNVTVYSSSGEVVGKIEDNTVVIDEIPCFVKEDTKIFYIPVGDDYHLELTGIDYGKMDYSVREYSEEYGLLRLVEFYDVDLSPGIVYESDISDNTGDPHETYAVSDGTTTTVPSIDTVREIEAPLYTLTINGGETDYDQVMSDEKVSINAVVPEHDSFAKWLSDDQDVYIEDPANENTTVRIASHDTTITAHFASNHQWNEEYTVDIEPGETSPGSKSIHCSICDEIQEGSQVEIPSIGDSGTISSGTCGENVTWILLKDGTLTISGTGEMYDYSITDPDKSPWSSYWNKIKSIVIEKGVTRIGNYAFHNCYYSTNVVMPDSVTKIGSNAFAYCSYLKNIVIPDNITSIGTNAFCGCKNLTSVAIPDGVTTIETGTFDGCINLKSITIPDGVTSIKPFAFNSCSSLSNIIIPDGVTEIGDMALFGCSSLTELIIPGSVTIVSLNAFENCTNLKNVTFYEGLQQIKWRAFYGCTSLESLHIPSSVVSIGRFSFTGCTSMTGITVESGNANYSSKDGVLFNKDFTKLVCYPSGKGNAFSIPGSVTAIEDGAFSSCTKLKDITVNSDHTCFSSIDGVLFNKDCTELICYPAGKEGFYSIPENVTKLSSDSFFGCNELTSVTIPGSITKIATFVFKSCTSLTDIVIPSSVTSIDDFAFDNCPSLSVVYFIGSQEEFDSIKIGNYNAGLTDAKIVYVNNVNSLKYAEISGLSASEYIGNAIEPVPVVRLLGAVLEPGKDYTVSYSNNTSAGSASLTITGLGDYVDSVTADFTINPASISGADVTGLASKTYTGKALTQSPTVKIGSTTLVSGTDYSISYENNTNAGTAVMKITGKGNYTGLVSKNFTINKAAQSITASNLTLTFPKTGTITASGNKGKLTYKSSNTAVAAIDSTGKVTSKGAGTAKITITAAATDNYNAETKTITVTINKAAQSITAKAKASSVAVGKTTTVSITGAKGKKSYKSSNTSLATVTSAGKVTAKRVGTVTITATSGATANYKAASKTVTIKIIPKPTTISSLSPAKGAITVKWKKQASQTSGYQIQYSSKSDFKTQKTVTVSGASKVSKKISGLAKKHKYYVRIRTYKTVGGKKYFSTWSSAKSVKTK